MVPAARSCRPPGGKLDPRRERGIRLQARPALVLEAGQSQRIRPDSGSHFEYLAAHESGDLRAPIRLPVARFFEQLEFRAGVLEFGIGDRPRHLSAGSRPQGKSVLSGRAVDAWSCPRMK